MVQWFRLHASAGDPVQSVVGELRFLQATWRSQKNKPKHQTPGILILPPPLISCVISRKLLNLSHFPYLIKNEMIILAHRIAVKINSVNVCRNV